MKVSPVAKAWVAGVGTIVTALSSAFADNLLSGNEAAGLASTAVLAALTIYGVYRTPNKPSA